MSAPVFITLTLDLYDNNGSGVTSGIASLVPSAELVDNVNHMTITRDPVTVSFSDGAFPTVKLRATSDLDPQPLGWTWQISFAGQTTPHSSFSFFLNASGGLSQNLSAQTPVQSGTAFQAYMPLPSGTPTAGQVPEATGAGEASVWTTVSGSLLCPPTSYAPVSLTSLTVSSTAMAAFSSANVNTGSFIAPKSGSVLVSTSFVMQQSVSAGAAIGLAAHGTVSPMVTPSYIFRDSTGPLPRAYTLNFVVTGLTAGQSYNFDLMGCMTTADSMSIVALGNTSASPALSLGASAGPVVMTVQGV